MAITKVINDLIDLNATDATKSLKMPSGAAYSGTAQDGMVRNSSEAVSQGSANVMQHFNGIDWKNYENLSNTVSLVIDFLVVGGGGSAGVYTLGSSGGGAGGVKRTSNYGGSETPITGSLGTAYDVTVGPGGASPNTSLYGSNGGSSLFNGVTSIGGGGGGSDGTTTFNGVNGASGGGGGPWDTNLGLGGTGSDGSDGGKGNSAGSCGSGGCGGGGGGGFTSAGTNVNGATPNGGTGVEVNIIGGTGNFYAGGGGGAKLITANYALGGAGGSGGGGNSALVSGGAGISGTLNTGGGGGGGFALTAGNGGSGTVILRYPTASVASFSVTGTLDTTTDTAYPIANSAYYKLDSNGNDSSGNGINGTVNNVSFVNGRFNNAGNFNGTNSSIYLGSTAFQYTSLTISAWIYPTAASSGTILQNYESGGSPTNSGWLFRMNSDRTIIFGAYGNASYGLVTTTTVSLNTWTNVTVTFSPNSSAIYFNGVAQSISTSGNAPYGTIQYNTGGNGNPTSIGRLDYTGGSSSYFTGLIDQLRVFNSYLSASNITSLYNEGIVVESTDGTDSILQFIGGTGTVTFS